jgi:hypothetical protein
MDGIPGQPEHLATSQAHQRQPPAAMQRLAGRHGEQHRNLIGGQSVHVRLRFGKLLTTAAGLRTTMP